MNVVRQIAIELGGPNFTKREKRLLHYQHDTSPLVVMTRSEADQKMVLFTKK